MKSAKRERALDYSKLAAGATSPPICVGSTSDVRSNWHMNCPLFERGRVRRFRCKFFYLFTREDENAVVSK